MEALYFGVPLLMVPQDGHQTPSANRVVKFGLRKTLHAFNLSPGALRESLNDLVENQALQRRLQKAKAELRALNSTERVIGIIEDMLIRRQ